MYACRRVATCSALLRVSALSRTVWSALTRAHIASTTQSITIAARMGMTTVCLAALDRSRWPMEIGELFISKHRDDGTNMSQYVSDHSFKRRGRQYLLLAIKRSLCHSPKTSAYRGWNGHHSASAKRSAPDSFQNSQGLSFGGSDLSILFVGSGFLHDHIRNHVSIFGAHIRAYPNKALFDVKRFFINEHISLGNTRHYYILSSMSFRLYRLINSHEQTFLVPTRNTP